MALTFAMRRAEYVELHRRARPLVMAVVRVMDESQDLYSQDKKGESHENH